MEELYTYCAAIGGVLLVGQLLLNCVGIGHDVDLHDVSVDFHGDVPGDGFDHEGGWYTGMLSFRAIVAATTVFGLSGLSARRQFDPLNAGIIALLAGGSVLYAVGWIMRTLYGLKSEGTVHIERAVGQPGSVYLTIPGRKSGVGKVTVKVQDRTMQYRAMTPDEELPSGTPVVVLGLLAHETLEVAKASETPVEGDRHVEL